jgi:DNA-binding response OmpR family regulator
MSVSVLLVEDEKALARAVADNLEAEGWAVTVVERGDRAVAAVRDRRPGLVILDLMLPGRSGLDVLRDLRASGDGVPVLVLTARADVVDRVVGLELGADDYLPKPFAMRELLARARALLRRSAAQPHPAPPLRLGGVAFDFRALSARAVDGPAALTVRDIRVLQVLAVRRGEAVSRIDIVEEVCGLDSEATLRTVDNSVVALRRAIGDDPRRPRWLQTVRGEGYRLARDDG